MWGDPSVRRTRKGREKEEDEEKEQVNREVVLKLE